MTTNYNELTTIDQLAAAFNPDSASSCKQIINRIKALVDDGWNLLKGLGVYEDDRLPSEWAWEAYQWTAPLAYGEKVVEDMRLDGYTEAYYTFRAVRAVYMDARYNFEDLNAYRVVFDKWTKKQIREFRAYVLSLDDETVMNKAVRLARNYEVYDFDTVKGIFNCICGNDTYVDFKVAEKLNAKYSYTLINIAQRLVRSRVLRYYNVACKEKTFAYKNKLIPSTCTIDYLSDNYEYDWGDDYNYVVLAWACEGLCKLAGKENTMKEEIRFDKVEKVDGDYDIVRIGAYNVDVDYYVSYRNSVNGGIRFTVLNHTFTVTLDKETSNKWQQEKWIEFKQALDDYSMSSAHMFKFHSTKEGLAYIEIEPQGFPRLLLAGGNCYKVRLIED